MQGKQDYCYNEVEPGRQTRSEGNTACERGFSAEDDVCADEGIQLVVNLGGHFQFTLKADNCCLVFSQRRGHPAKRKLQRLEACSGLVGQCTVHGNSRLEAFFEEGTPMVSAREV